MKLFKISLVILAIVLSNATLARNSNDLYSKIKNIIDTEAGDINIGIYFKNLNTGKAKFALHADRLFIPASTTKLFTAYSALNHLGAEFKFKTCLYADKEINTKQKKLDSDLYIKFTADPSLKYTDLQNIFAKLDINKIARNVVIDDSLIDEHTNAPGGFTWDNNPFCYAAPKSAIIIDKNCSEAWMSPNSLGKVAKLDIDRPYVLRINNTVETVAPKKYQCPYKSKYVGSNNYDVYGCIFNDDHRPVRLNFALQDNRKMVVDYINKLLLENNIKLKGEIKFGKASGKNTIYVHESPPLKEIFVDILQDSCNVSAGSLFKFIAAKQTGREGNDEDGEWIMKNFLTEQGFHKKSFKLKDGAGESRYNLLSPKALVNLLSKVHSSPRTLDIFVSTLPQYGKEGTLRYRQIKDPYHKYIHAKTGNLENSSALAGFYMPPKGPHYAFAIMISNHNLTYSDVKSLEDQILYRLLDDSSRANRYPS